ncbi:MAG: hypothetical protein HW409_1067 [candidate division NC10 bacterium]|jgi:hypothetical protein|nr:hypothetical protein [candidate division NC10 bacterium]
MIVEPAGGQGKPLPGVAHPHHRPTTQYRFRQIDSLYKRRHGPRCPGGGEKVVAIQGEPPDADKEIPGIDLSGIVPDPSDIHIEGTVEDLILSPFN